MKCPKCGSTILLHAAREVFVCPSCHERLRANLTRTSLVALVISGVIWLLAEAVYFEFRSEWISALVLAASYGAAFWIASRWALERTSEEGREPPSA